MNSVRIPDMFAPLPERQNLTGESVILQIGARDRVPQLREVFLPAATLLFAADLRLDLIPRV